MKKIIILYFIFCFLIITTCYSQTGWIKSYVGSSSNIVIHFFNQNTGYLINEIGLIYKSTDGGNVFVNSISSEIPSSFCLPQNYPNPFNRSSKIKIGVPFGSNAKLGDVKLVVYDIMGREIETLINERLQPGTYEVIFDGSNLNSGVYFYRLTAEDYSETKKMLMIK